MRSVVFEQHPAGGKLEPVHASGIAHDGERFAVRAPVREVRVLEELPRRAAGERRLGEHSPEESRIGRQVRVRHPKEHAEPRRDEKCHLAGGGNGENLRPRETERARLGAVEARGKELGGLALELCGVDHRLTAWRKPRRGNAGAAERQLPETRRGGPRALGASAEEVGPGQRCQQRSRQADRSPSSPAPWNTEVNPGLAREVRDVLAQSREVSREVLRGHVAVPRLLGEAPLDDPANLARGPQA